jgi:signal transduction histidine kinase
MHTDSGRRHGPDDLALAEQIAHDLALAVENALAQAHTRREAEARGDLLGLVSHDLKNPLGAVVMNATFLLKHAAGNDAVAQRGRAVAANIIHAAERMQRLIADLQDAATVDTGRFAVEPQPHEVAGLIAEAVELMRPIAAHKGLALEAEVGGGRRRVVCDRERVIQVLSNLIGNAIKFTPEGGAIAVRVEAGVREMLFSVADTGCGIAPDHLPHLFDRYWQVRPNDRRGVGLGLFIVKAIVEAHGGRLRVESRLGEGTTFFFTLPAAV